jgi:hypothetical protein
MGYQGYQDVEYFTMAAEQGHAVAQCNLGNMFKNGQGVEQSYEKAVEYYTMAAEQGHAVAQCILGTMFYNGQGVEQSCPIARKWWTKAANQRQEDAINYLKKTPEKIEGTTTTSSSRCSACGKPTRVTPSTNSETIIKQNPKISENKRK